MQVQLNTDNHIEGNARLTNYVETLVQDSLARFANRITRVEVHLADQNSGKKSGSDDKRCSMEARISGRQPITVSADAPTVDQALGGAVDKLEKALTTTFDRIVEVSRGRSALASEEAI